MTTSTQGSKAYNLHTTGFGYLNRIRRIKPSKGNPYYAAQFVALEGVLNGDNWNELNRTYYDIKFVGPAVKIVEENFKFVADSKSSNIDNADLPDNTIVQAAVKLADCNAETYSAKDRDGNPVTRISLKSRLLNMSYLKIGDTEIRFEHTDQESNSDTPAEETQGDENAVTTEAQEVTAAEADADVVEKVEIPTEIKLDQDDPKFADKIHAVKLTKLYAWSREKTAWVKKEAANAAPDVAKGLLAVLAA